MSAIETSGPVTGDDAKGVVILEASGLTRRFEGLVAVNGLDLTVRAGEIFGLIGPNGSGKTTTLHLLTGFLRPTGGDVVFEGKSVRGLAPSKIARRGLVRTFQLTNVFGGLTTLQNVVHSQHLRAKDDLLRSFLVTPAYRREQRRLRERAEELLRFVGFTPDRMRVLASKLSAGEQRRLEIAIVLATEPKLVLLDEPASGLNRDETDDLMAVLRSLKANLGITVVLVEHNTRMVLDVCNRIAVLDFGRKIADGTPEEIAKDDAVLRAYLGTARDA